MPVGPAAVHVDDAAVTFEFFRRAGRAVPVQVGGRGDEHAPAGRQPPRDEVGVRGRVDAAVVELQRQLREKRVERGPQGMRPNVTEVVILDAGHWLMEEAPEATRKAIRQFVE